MQGWERQYSQRRVSSELVVHKVRQSARGAVVRRCVGRESRARKGVQLPVSTLN